MRPEVRMKIGIIGTGRIGLSLAEVLAERSICDEIALWRRDEERLDLTIKSLSMWKDIRNLPLQFTKFQWDSIEDYDLIVLAIKDCYDVRKVFERWGMPSWLPRQMRYAGLLHDLPLIVATTERLSSYCGVICVITNPVDLVSNVVAKIASRSTVFGLGCSLDAVRLGLNVKEMGTTEVVNPFSLICGGEHGPSSVPLLSLWPPNISDTIPPFSLIRELIMKGALFGESVVRSFGYTLYDAVESFAYDIEWILAPSLESIHCLSSPFESSFTGQPFRESNGELKLLTQTLTHAELRLIEETCERHMPLLERIQWYV